MTNENVYSIDFEKLAKSRFLTFLRLPLHLIFLNSFVAPIVQLYNQLLSFRTESLYKLNHNSQVIYMQSMLNDSFDNDLRRIRIRNAEIKEPVWFYEPLEEQPVYFYEPDEAPVYFREDFEFLGGGSDFTVFVPIDLKPIALSDFNAYITKMSAKIDYYKLYSKGYQITFI